MKAIVLTYDKYRTLTEHMILKYQQLWPNYPFCFRIPYQNLPGENTSKCEYIHCPIDIKGTVLTLLQDLNDDEWIYWCIDDKYPIFLDLPRIEVVMNWAINSSSNQCSSVLFCRIRDVLNGKALRQNWIGKDVKLRDSFGNCYLLRKNYEQIWIHQFLRVKVIRYLFEELPDTIENAKVMDSLKYKVSLPESHRLFVTKENLAIFGESTSRGKLTLNCYESIVRNNLPLPKLALDEDKTIILGGRSSNLTFANKFEFWSSNFYRKLKSYTKLKS
jgi:hypothetical protein